MSAVGAQLAALYKEDARTSVSLIGLRKELSDRARMLLVALCGAGGCVLLIACANLAALLLARALARQSELEVRAALGAGRERLVRQLITESLLLALCGGLVGVLLAGVGLPLLTRLVPSNLPVAQQPTLDLRAFAVAAVLSGITGLAFGVVPALRAGRGAQFGFLRGGSRAGGGRRERLRSVLVAIEVAVSVVLLVGTGLLLRALDRLQATDAGFRPESVLTLRTALPQPKYSATQRRTEFYQSVLTGARAIPGVTDAAYTTAVPLSWKGGIWPVSIAGETWGREAAHSASLRFVTPRYFAAMGIPVRRGRDVSDADTWDRLTVAVVSESFASHYWPGQDSLGRRFSFGMRERTVVGVVGEVKVRGLEQISEPQVYLPYQQVGDESLLYYSPKDLIVRSVLKPEVLLPNLRTLVHAADPEQPISDVRRMTDIVTTETASRAVQARVIGAFALLAAVLAAVGIHGLLSFAVSQRRREIGVRRALGAQSSSIVRDVVWQGALTAAAGLVPGLLLAYVAARGLEALLVGVGPADPVTFLVVAGFCGAMTVLGSLAPALGAVRVDPMTAVRTE
jgi:predicted permease